MPSSRNNNNSSDTNLNSNSQANTTNVITYSYTVDARLRFDRKYMFTLSGIIKTLTTVIVLGGLITASVTDIQYSSEGDYYKSVAGSAMSFTGLMTQLYTFHVCEKFHKLPWLKIELLLCGCFAVMFLIASILAIKEASSITVATVFAFAAMGMYTLEVVLKGRAVSNGEIAQGTRQIVRQPGQTPC